MQEWKVYEFKELVNLSKEKYNPKSETMNLPCIELEHIESETGRLLGYTNSIEQQSIKNKFKANDILYGKLRPYLRKFYFPNFEGVCSSEIWVLQSIEEKIHNKYLYYLIQTNKFNEHANKSSGTKMPRADWNYISEITFPIPPIKEQQKIASILSTWDKAIELKEKLIEQKKQQKKGLMQKLLTGEVRLPGFDGEWKKVKLAKVVRKTKGKAVEYIEGGKFPAIDMDYLESGTFKNYSNDATVFAEKNDVLLLWDGSRAGMAFTGVEGAVGSTFVKLECKSIHNIFLQKHFEMNEQRIQRLREGSGIPHVPKDFLDYYKVKMPSMEEQKAIAYVLNNMDRDLELLWKEVAYLKEQKQGLMQLLLTGKVRVQV
ncbi:MULTISPECIES: restriction endonuclease subunit S [Heyndrickxia]|uniref:restriction endonuclease subunit S n=1 Tax=Heyndrickxia TaxID=2837504 RepID=UPI002E239080|nr:restriction endonuclease subunit S [Weizmannia sp. CD-2023]MED4891034.1 restriction endonuclease subunit S [Weizmannia sp. CD-2023]